MRIRERTVADRTVSGSVQYTNGTGAVTTTWAFSDSPSVYDRMQDVVIPRFYERMNSGEVFFNSMLKEQRDVILQPGDLLHSRAETPSFNHTRTVNGKKETVVQPQWDGFSRIGDYYNSALDSGTLRAAAYADLSVDVSDPSQQAINTAFANIDASDATALVSLAELGKTVATIKSVLYKSFKIAKAIKKLDAKALKGELSASEVADAYLEYRYGIRPMIIDAEQAVKAYNASLEHSGRRTARGSESSSDSDTVVKTSSEDYTVDEFDGSSLVSVTRSRSSEFRVSKSVTVSSRATVLYNLEPISLPALKVWGFYDIPLAMWELVPFSFMINWFVDVSTALAAWTPKIGVRELGSCVTTTTETVVQEEYTHRPYYHSGSWCGTFSDGHTIGETLIGEYEYPTISRLTTSREVVRAPGISPGLPQIDVNLNFLKVLDMALIARNMFSNR